jgi:carbon starvation protein CstA
MNETNDRPIRKLLPCVAALVVSLASLLPLYWGLFILGDYGERATDPFPVFLRVAIVVSLIIVILGAAAVGNLWRTSPLHVALVAAAPYLFLAVACGAVSGFLIDVGAGSLVFMVFYVMTRRAR